MQFKVLLREFGGVIPKNFISYTDLEVSKRIGHPCYLQIDLGPSYDVECKFGFKKWLPQAFIIMGHHQGLPLNSKLISSFMAHTRSFIRRLEFPARVSLFQPGTSGWTETFTVLLVEGAQESAVLSRLEEMVYDDHTILTGYED